MIPFVMIVMLVQSFGIFDVFQFIIVFFPLSSFEEVEF